MTCAVSGREELGFRSPVCTQGGLPLHGAAALARVSHIESSPFIIIRTGGAEPCMCYGPYVETCLSRASQMVPNSTHRSHLETFRGSAQRVSTF